MKQLLIFLYPLFAVLFGFTVSPAAPVPAIGPMNIEGVIETVSWEPDAFIKAQGVWSDGKWIPFSGSLGHDRTRPAHYRITLAKTRVKSLPEADWSRSFRGDEGGDWYSFRAIEIKGTPKR
ncbi:MAG: hypothetical protein ACP5R6_08730 [Chlorobaculum sp.]